MARDHFWTPPDPKWGYQNLTNLTKRFKVRAKRAKGLFKQPMDFLLQFIAYGRWLTPGPANGFSIVIYGFWVLADPRSGVSQWIFYCNLWLLGAG